MRVQKLHKAPDISAYASFFGPGYAKEQGEDYRNEWWGVKHEGKLVAVAAARRDRRKLILTFAAVDPMFRGLGLQRRLIRARIRWADGLRLNKIVTYVNFGNEASYQNLLDEDFVEVSANQHARQLERAV